MDKYRGKVAVVTGASSGIGKAVVEALVKRGVIVAGLARRVERVEELVEQLEGEEGKLHPFSCDLTDKDQTLDCFSKIIEEIGPIHILVNNAGLSIPGNFIDGDYDSWKTVLDTNILALSICSQQAMINMRDNNTTGHIININSILGHIVHDLPGMNVYSASKFAVTGLTESIRHEINRDALLIKISCISPGLVDTEFIDKAMGAEFGELVRAGRSTLCAEDVCGAVMYVLGTPDHVNVHDVILSAQGVLS